MSKCAFGSALGLLIIAGNLGVAAPAKAATLWRNYDTHAGAFYLSLVSTSPNRGQAVVIQPYNGLPSQLWTRLPGYSDPNFARFETFNQLVVGVAANNMNPGTPLVDWTATGELNQDWFMYPFVTDHSQPLSLAFVYDAEGAPCFAFVNGNNPTNHTFVAGVSAGIMTNNRPVIIWDDFDDLVHHPDQYWCKYQIAANGSIVPED
jgi:hypothetical protein